MRVKGARDGVADRQLRQRRRRADIVKSTRGAKGVSCREFPQASPGPGQGEVGDVHRRGDGVLRHDSLQCLDERRHR